MGKRSDFKRKEWDYYPTPYEAAFPLIMHLEPGTKYDEPCAGDGALMNHLGRHGHECWQASDINPRREDIEKLDAFNFKIHRHARCIITNPPWDRDILHPLIERFRKQAPTWLLFDADWAHTRQAQPYLAFCHRIISVGRVKWFPGSKHTGKDNCAWYLFDKEPADTIFVGRC